MKTSISSELEARFRARPEVAGVTVEAYNERIARDDQAAEEELEALPVEGLNSRESIGTDQRHWEEKRKQLIGWFTDRETFVRYCVARASLDRPER